MKLNLNTSKIRCCATAGTSGVINPSNPEYTSPEGRLGLYVENGRFMRRGKEYYGMGANFYDMFTRTIGAGIEDFSSLKLIEEAAAYGVPFLRFSAGAYAPFGWQGDYLIDPEPYFQKLDKLVYKASECGIGLIPSFFWLIPTIVDINEEHMDQLENPNSKVINFIGEYTRQLVTRYAHLDAIWAWEFGNEFSLSIDIPHKPTPAILQGSWATERDPVRDVLTQKGMLTAFTKFVETVRQYDTDRPVLSGNDSPRSTAYHNTHSDLQDWVQDTPEQHKTMIEIYEGPMNTITTRGYFDPGTMEQRHLYPANCVEYRDYLAWQMGVSAEVGKPLFLGEFGPREDAFELYLSPYYPTARTRKQKWEMRFAAVLENKVQLSAFWNYGYASDDPAQTLIYVGNDPDGVLDMLLETNRRLTACCKC